VCQERPCAFAAKCVYGFTEVDLTRSPRSRMDSGVTAGRRRSLIRCWWLCAACQPHAWFHADLPGSIPIHCMLDWQDMGSHGSTRALSVARACVGGLHRTRHRGQRIVAVRSGAMLSTWQRLEGCGRISHERDRHPDIRLLRSSFAEQGLKRGECNMSGRGSRAARREKECGDNLGACE